MFGLFKSKRSPVHKGLKALLWVHRSWFEWQIERDRRECVLVVEMAIDLDPDDPDFEMARIDDVARVVARHGDAGRQPDRIRVIPRMYGL